jgi:hypothetical protein
MCKNNIINRSTYLLITLYTLIISRGTSVSISDGDLNRVPGYSSTRGRPETSGMTRVDRVKSNTGITRHISDNNK